MQASAVPASAEDALIGALLTLGRRMRQRLPEDGFDPSLMPVLKALQTCGPARHTLLAERLGLDASTVSRKVRHLEELGLVEVVADREDGRARQVQLLPRGVEALEQLLTVRRDVVGRVLEAWPEPDRRRLKTLLDRFTADLEGMSSDVSARPGAPVPA